MTGLDEGGPHYSMLQKASFAIEPDGKLRLLVKGGEPVPALSDLPAGDMSTDCRAFGAVANHRTTWFPYTGVFVRAGSLMQARLSATGLPGIEVLPLTENERGQMLYTGKDADETEFSYAPCVGPHRVGKGWRLNGYLPSGGQLRLRGDDGRVQTLELPLDFEPLVLVRRQHDSFDATRMTAVLVTVDLVEQRVVVQFQHAFEKEPDIQAIVQRTLLHDGKRDFKRSRERHHTLSQDPGACETPSGLPIALCMGKPWP